VPATQARGTQTVFGEGAQGAKVIFLGEQPGDKDDLEESLL
jgi:uracil-DNA glycosylase